MKNLPDKFPIRYALIVKSPFDDEFDDYDIVAYHPEFKEFEICYRQFLSTIQKEPLSKKMIHMNNKCLVFSLFGIEVMRISQIEQLNSWDKELENFLKKIIPEIKTDYKSYGNAFTLGLYSYAGNYEIPSFIRAKKYFTKNAFSGHSSLGNIDKTKTDSLIKLYESILSGKIKDWEYYQYIRKYEKPVYITSPYSDLWKALDNQLNGGTIPTKKDIKLTNNEIRNLAEKNHYKERISIAVCKNWETLFAEEISTLYKMFNFCNNCGKALPFDYQGKYCPETKDNKECIKERARKRARKKSQI
jgi:hypothetical protein